MKILVCISHVPDTTSKINFVNSDTEFDTNGVQFVINPNDEFGLTRAIWFQEQQGAHVTVLNVGEATSEPTLRKALAIGANEAVRINAKPIDSIYVAYQIAEYCKNNAFDIIICGKESIDYNGGMVGGLVASMLDMNYITNCIDMKVDNGLGTLTREIDGGVEISESSLPILVAGQKGLVEEKDLKIPNMRGIMTARTKPLAVIEPIDVSFGTKDVKFEKPAPKGAVKLVDADNIDQLIDLLHNEAKVL